MKNMKLGMTRRRFLERCGKVGVMGLGATATNLSLMNAAAAACVPDGGSDYKALVCVFLFGGNDSHNLFVPTANSVYNTYASERGNLALGRAELLAHPITAPGYDDGFNGNVFGMHPNLDDEYDGTDVTTDGGLRSLYQENRLALMANVGSLTAPIASADDFEYDTAPPQLFSHNSQQFQWQTAWADTALKTGWGGRVADILACLNGNAAFTTSIALNGFNTYQVGDLIAQYALQSNGQPAGLDGPNHLKEAAASLLGVTGNWLGLGYDGVKQRALDSFEALSTVLENAPEPPLANRFPPTHLGRQLRAAALMMSVRNQLASPLRRQVYMCSTGGFDTHGNQNDEHPRLMSEVSQAITAFQRTMEAMGLEQNVTLFTASDFNRTWTSNGKGSDHAWGGHQLVVGGAVDGGKVYGQLPELALASSLNIDDDRGHFIPTTSVEQYAAVLANWFGVPESMLPDVFPNYARFESPLGTSLRDFIA